MLLNKIHNIDCIDGLKQLDSESVNCCVTSPPYWNLRDYNLSPTEWPEVTYALLPGTQEITVPKWIGCLGLEPTIEMFVGHIVFIFREVRRVLRKDGTLWLNFGDSYCSTAPGTMGDNVHIEGTKEATKRARKIMRPDTPKGLKPKDLCGIPWRIAFALQADGWYLRSDIIWHKPNPMPESVTDRPTKAHEYIFLMSKNQKYYYDAEVIKEPCVDGDPNPPRGSIGVLSHVNKGRRTHSRGTKRTPPIESAGIGHKDWCKYMTRDDKITSRNKRTVWEITTQPFKGAHFATFPPKLIEPCILAGCPQGGVVLDPFMGSGTTAMVAMQLQRNFIGFELNPKYIEIAEKYRLSFIQQRII